MLFILSCLITKLKSELKNTFIKISALTSFISSVQSELGFSIQQNDQS